MTVFVIIAKRSTPYEIKHKTRILKTFFRKFLEPATRIQHLTAEEKGRIQIKVSLECYVHNNS